MDFSSDGLTRLDIRQTDDGGFKRLRHATDPHDDDDDDNDNDDEHGAEFFFQKI